MKRRLDQAARLVAKWFCFAVFGLGGVVLTLLVFPVLRLFVRSAATRKHYAQYLISKGFALFVCLMRICGLCTYEVSGRENLRPRGCVVVANHPSLIDVVLLVSLMPRVDCIVKRRLWRNPFVGGPVRAAGYIRNDHGQELVEKARRSLSAGNNLLIFPEGTRTRPGEPMKFQRGAASIAVHARADVIPVTIRFSEPFLTKQTRWYNISSKKLHIFISIDRPISVAPYLERHGRTALAAREFSSMLLDYYLERLGDSEGVPRRAFDLTDYQDIKGA